MRKMNTVINWIGLLLVSAARLNAKEIHTSKVFIMTIEPSCFNWTDSKNDPQLQPGQFTYRPSLRDAPDLPSWIHYTYSEHQSRGFIYGSAPPQQKDFEIEVIGLNKKTYEARRRIIKMKVLEMAEPALSEVQLKVDKMNVEDVLDAEHYTRLLKIFHKDLWPESRDDLYITFLASAVRLGARLPVNPTDGEGVVFHIGSRAPFSKTLLELEKEIHPLKSKGLKNCPDFKHTSVERFFKQHNFSLDWCAFRLVSINKVEHKEVESQERNDGLEGWKPVSRAELPTRQYMTELAFILAVTLMILIALVTLITYLLCFHHDSMKQNEETPHSQLVQYEAVQRASNNLRSMSTQRDCDDSTPRVSVERSGFRPNPPPYTGAHNVTREDEYVEDDDAKTWYC